jgi:DNA-binding MarR family transcriptional regulator
MQGDEASFEPALDVTTLLREILTISDEFEVRLAKRLGVGRSDLKALEHLIEDGPLSPGELARRLGLTAPAMSLLVDRLAAAGHVHRQAHPSDRRSVHVVPDAASVARALGDLVPMVRAIDEVGSKLEPRDRAAVVGYLAEVTRAYRESLPNSE